MQAAGERLRRRDRRSGCTRAASRRPVWELAPHSVFVAPTAASRIGCGPCRVWGWAWSAVPVQAVQVKVDGEAHWRDAAIDARVGFCWQRFTFDWTPQSKGPHELACRATDAKGNVQPESGARNSVMRVQVTVE